MIRNRLKNNQFKKNNPNITLPPDYLIYESFQLNYHKYYIESIETCKWLVEILKKYKKLENVNILDWGCGPGRIIRHISKFSDKKCTFFGTDYNKKSIDWCLKNLPNIQFNYNSMTAELPYKDNSMDIIYGISVFTHLSEESHYNWFNELFRILRPNGVLLLTTQGDNFKKKLNTKELINFNNGQLIIRGNVKQGHRTFSAFQPTNFMKSLSKKAKILNHITPSTKNNTATAQDIWIFTK